MYTRMSRISHVSGMDGLSLMRDHTPMEFPVAIAQLQQSLDRAEAEQHSLVLCKYHGFIDEGGRRWGRGDPHEMFERPVPCQFVNDDRDGVCGMHVDDLGIGTVELECVLLLCCPTYDGDPRHRYERRLDRRDCYSFPDWDQRVYILRM